MILFVSDFFITLPEKALNKPTVLVPTPNHDAEVLRYASRKAFPKSLVYPLKSREFEPQS